MLKVALDVLAVSCVGCWLMQRTTEHPHLQLECPYPPRPVTDPSIVLSTGFCYGCGCPQHVSDVSELMIWYSHCVSYIIQIKMGCGRDSTI
jgi:hypothetical protein